MYEPIEGHFLTVINYRIYDVRGDVTSDYADKSLLDWKSYKHRDSLHAEHIERDCIRMEEYN